MANWIYDIPKADVLLNYIEDFKRSRTWFETISAPVQNATSQFASNNFLT